MILAITQNKNINICVKKKKNIYHHVHNITYKVLVLVSIINYIVF